MGGGHRGQVYGQQPLEEQPTAQYFLPEYGLPGTANTPIIKVVGETNTEDIIPSPYLAPVLTYFGTEFQADTMVSFMNGGLELVAKDFALIRLGSVTHSFNMDQRFQSLTAYGSFDTPGTLLVEGPLTASEAPPGYYMLFLRTEDGEISRGEYVRLPPFYADGSPPRSGVYVCPATASLVATETSCTAEPVGGACPIGSEQENTIGLPSVDSLGSPVLGWHVLAPVGDVADPQTPTEEELEILDARCIAACTAHWSSGEGITANCDDPAAFDLPEHFYDGAPGPYDLVLPDRKSGEGFFEGQSLACELDSTCCNAFDESLCPAVPDRTTPANDALGIGQEYLVALARSSNVQLHTVDGTYSSRLSGSAGYSFCRDGSATAACPFYLGSFAALATNPITVPLTCEDGSTTVQLLEDFTVTLSQPAFGIAEGGGMAAAKGFPAGGLIFETSFTVGRQHFSKRRPSGRDVVITANGAAFSVSNLPVSLEVPCNGSKAIVNVNLSAGSSATGALGAPPTVVNTTLAVGACGLSRPLTATVFDPNGDAGTVRWRVDGVLMAPGTTSMVVTGSHTVEAVVHDSRGAATTAKKAVSCI